MTLDVASLLRFRQSCKYVYTVSLTKQLWLNVYLRDITAQHLPFAPYWKKIDALSGKQLKDLILHTLRLGLSSRTSIAPAASVTWVRLVQSQWLLVASSDDITSVITLWSVTSLLTSNTRSPAPLAEAFLPAPVATGKVDVVGSCVVLALELCGRIPQIEILSIVKTLFSRLQTLHDLAHLLFLKGDYLGLSVANNINIPCIVNWKELYIIKLRTLLDLQGGAAAMYMADGWIAVLRRSVLEAYTHDGHHYTT
ncbi:hypothetical protein QCA50_016933 [Cerrena zonata]|uniref:F-box domain-containing protein n=1 Tax=Cerrena zonata TaxID=2478898 RepID=A0AAW0FI93_9APHY